MEDPNRLHPGSAALFVGGKTYSALEVVAAADFRGELQPRWRSFVTAEAFMRAARTQQLEPDASALQEMSDTFRYDHDLVTEEETEAWLAARGATVDDFHDFIIRRYWAAALSPSHRPEGFERPFTPDAIEGPFGLDLVLSGDFHRMAMALARRAAVGPSDGEAPEAQTLEAAYAAHCGTILHDAHRARVLQALRLPLTRVTIEVIEVDTLDAAREAALCIRDDGIAMRGLAEEQGYPYTTTELCVEDVDETLGRTFLAAVPGDVLDPIRNEGRYQVCRLIDKVEPTLSDDRVGARIDKEILDSHFADLVRQRVRWLIPEEGRA